MTDAAQFFPSSSQANDIKIKKSKYPWEDCPDGCSFVVSRDKIKLISLVSMANKASKKLGCKFIVVDHGEGQPYEVARKVIHKSIVDLAKE